MREDGDSLLLEFEGGFLPPSCSRPGFTAGQAAANGCKVEKIEFAGAMQRPNSVQRLRAGFTLIEIMIVVLVIGILAAMAIPGYQKIRQNAIGRSMDNDARQLASAAQQYFTEFSVTKVALGYSAGTISGPLQPYVKKIGTMYTDMPSALSTTDSFSINHPLLTAPQAYSPEGQRQ